MEKKIKDARYSSDPHMVRTPTLLIGIGGIGRQIVQCVHDSMSEYDKTYVKMIVMDTDVNSLDSIDGTGISYIQTSENQTVQAYLTANVEYSGWFPTNPLINAKNLTQGAGQIRSVSRLGALASKAEGKFSVIDDAIDAVLTNHGDNLTRSVRVMVVGSATGGTGSGLGVQLPFYLRNALERANIPNALIRGLFLMPSLTEGVQDTKAKESAVNVNGYAFLKEVNAFYHAQKKVAEDNVLRIEEYVPGLRENVDGNKELVMAGSVPYDFLYLVEKYGNKGSIGDLEDYIIRSAQIVMNQLFSPMSDKGFSAEDNLITSSVPTGGMNRYCGAGIANAIYPKDEVLRYCTVRYAEQLLKGYWLQIDHEFRRRDEQQRRLKKTNPNLVSLDKGATYCTIFDEMTDPSKHDVSSEVASLKGELAIKVSREEGDRTVVEDMPLVEAMLNYISLHIRTVFDEAGFAAEAESCYMDSTILKIPNEAESEVNDKMNRLRNFRSNAEKKVSALIVSTAEELLPSDLKSAQNVTRDARHNIYVMLENKHPIIARYVLYSLAKLLREAKAEADIKLEEKFNRESIFTKDYYREKGEDRHRESPREALAKTGAGAFSFMGLNSAAYNKLIKTISTDAADEAGHILEMSEYSLKSMVYRIVLERIDTLIGLYEKFFDELEKIMEDKAEEAKHLEAGKGSSMDEDFKGDKYICCNAQCKIFLYNQFEASVSDSEMEMSDEVKKGFFDKMFGEYATILTEKSNPTANFVHLSWRELFEQGILQPITAQFRDNGFKHIDMSILEAIKKQFEIENHGTESATDKEEFSKYFASLCASLRTLATPYLSYEREVAGYNSGGKLTYSWGLNHSAVAYYQSGDRDGAVDKQELNSMFVGDDNIPLADNSFSPYVMTCYASIYDLRIENCKMYRAGSVSQRCYDERLGNLADREFIISDEDDGYLDVIHPHLDRRWHEHAYLPELMEFDDIKMCNDIRLAFILAMALGRCEYYEDKAECLTCWWFQKSDSAHPTPVCVDSKVLRSMSLLALYNAFNSNRVIVSDVLKSASNVRNKSFEEIPLAGIDYDTLISQTIIKGFVGDEGKMNSNVLDLIYTLYSASGSRNEMTNLIKTLKGYLLEYCIKMENGNVNKANKMFEKVGTEICDKSVSLKASDVSKTFVVTCESLKNAE